MARIRRILVVVVAWLSLAGLWFWPMWHAVAHALGLPCPY